MKRNLLMLLFAMLIGAFTTKAADVSFTVDIDNASSAEVIVGYSPFDPAITLQNGVNTVSGPSDGAVFVKPLNGAELTVTANDNPLNLSGGGWYNTGIKDGLVLKIVSGTEVGGGDEVKKINTYFNVNPAGTVTLTTGSETFDITAATYDLPADEYAVVAPKEGYVISDFSTYFISDYTKNDDGTWSFKPADYGMVNITTKVVGLDFNVDINVADNVFINAYDENGEDLGLVNLEGYEAPFLCTAPKATKVLGFTAPEGGEITSIQRIEANGTITNLSGSGQGGWRSNFAAGDVYKIEAIGPECEITFSAMDESYAPIDMKHFVVKAGDKTLDLTGTDYPKGVVRVGDILSISAGKSYKLKENAAITAYCCTPIVTEGAERTMMVNKGGSITIFAETITDMFIDVDNAAAVTVKGGNGNGEALTLVDGSNKLTTVANPLRIEATEGYEIVSLTLDGETQEAVNGYYIVALEAGSTIGITTRKLPESFPVSIFAIGDGAIENLIIRQDGEIVDYPNEFLVVKPGSQITIQAAFGYVLNNLSDPQGNSFEENEDTHVWTVTFTKTASLITADFKAPAEGNAFVGFSTDNELYVAAYLYDKDGNRLSEPPSLTRNQTTEVPIGSQVCVNIYGSYYDLNTVTVNGVALEFEDGTKELEYFTIEGRTVIEVTTKEIEQKVTVAGDEAIETAVGTGAVLGTIYINKVGQRSAQLKGGDKFTVIPVPTKGYKFESFIFDLRTTEGLSDNLPVSEPVDGAYEFTLPLNATYLFIKGVFVIDNEKPSYMVEGNNLYDDAEDALETKLIGLIRICDPELKPADYADGSHGEGLINVFGYEGEEFELLFWQNLDEFPVDKYYLYSYCLMNKPEVLVTTPYKVNPKDVRDNNIISISAIVKERDSSVETIAAADATLHYDHATATVTSATDVRVYTLDGKLVKQLPAGEGSLESLASGVYVIVNGKEMVKIAK